MVDCKLSLRYVRELFPQIYTMFFYGRIAQFGFISSLVYIALVLPPKLCLNSTQLRFWTVLTMIVHVASESTVDPSPFLIH